MDMALLIAVVAAGLALVYALSRKPRSGRPGTSRGTGGIEWTDDLHALVPETQRDPTWNRVVTELLERLGADQGTIEEVLSAHGLEPEPSTSTRRRQPDEPTARRQDHQLHLHNVLEKALVIGIALAAADDDYGHVGDPPDRGTDRDDRLRAHAEQIESAVFDTRERTQYEFYSKASLVLQDMLEDTRDDQERRSMLQLRDHLEERLEALTEQMAALISSLQEAERSSDIHYWGDQEDRQLYYFMMGVTNTLRKHKAHFPALDLLYRAKGLGYNVEEAYDRIARECPTLGAAREIGVRKLLTYGFKDIKALVQSTLPKPRAG